MRLDVIDNSGAASMISELSKELGACRRARLATASLSRGGIGFIEEALHAGRASLRIQLLVGLYNGHTEAAALRRLFRMQKRFSGHIEIRIAQNGRFHWKTYLFESNRAVTAFVGSSNFTKDGLGVEGEFNIRIDSTRMSGVIGHIAETFDRVWKKHSVPLSVAIAEGFTSASNRSKEATIQIIPIIREILRAPRRSHTKRSPKKTAVMTSIEETVGRATIKVVKDKTDWYRKGFQWLVYTRKVDRDRLRKPGAFYLVEMQGKELQLSLNDVRDDDEFTTDDGRYFIAYRKRNGSVVKRVSPSTLALLRRAGVVEKKEDLQRDRRLSHANRETLDALLRVPHG
jgi:HKD family nuclease